MPTQPEGADQSPFDERLLYIIFCDQARTEETRKGLYIGVYGGTMIVEGDFPAFLASLSIAICIRPLRPKEKLRVGITMPGELKAHEFAKEHSAAHPDDTITWLINIAPFVCARPGYVRVKVDFEDGPSLERTLRVMSRPEYEKASLFWPKSDYGSLK